MDWLIFEDGVKRTPQTDIIIITKLQPYFERAGIIGRVTSVLRDSIMQLKTIQDLAHQNKLILDGYELDFNYMSTWAGQVVPYWQIVWSTLLNKGVVVNPPIPAICLMDYTAANGVNKKGMIIHETPHYTGLCFDTGGRCWENQEDVGNYNKLVSKIDTIYNVIKQASTEGVGIISDSVLIEHQNNCVHSQVSV